nr:MAG TPA: hypothetical protein [Caudoviricetes sp.]
MPDSYINVKNILENHNSAAEMFLRELRIIVFISIM